jgi:phosphoribosylformimino-5-aminoimidazole carboxamide ribotide isomerase
MIILPAVDIMNGQPVRLYQGDFARKEVVADSVAKTVQAFAQAGAEWVHLVDLDGAAAGHRVNGDLIAGAAGSISIPAEVGGGIRTMEDIDWYLGHGLARVILGTAAIADEQLLKQALAAYGERIAVGLDCRNGMVQTRGWLEGSSLGYLDAARHLESLGVRTLIVTDISRDGTLAGPNVDMLAALQQAVSARLIASGGVRDLASIEQLRRLDLYGAITGKAVYAGTLDLREAIRKGR